jgi:phospholipase/carboxylesterase
MDEAQELIIGEWTLRVRVPDGKGSHPVIFLIHGWTGDERSMWVFASRFPKEAVLIAPRAPFPSKHPEFGGFSWVPDRGESFSSFVMFEPAMERFNRLISLLENKLPGDFSRFGMAGFSQGAAFSFAYAMQNSKRVTKLAALAGFLPAESEERLHSLATIQIFIAHGRSDETIPISMARNARGDLGSIGSNVTYCESDTGHKLGSNCASLLAEFFLN